MLSGQAYLERFLLSVLARQRVGGDAPQPSIMRDKKGVKRTPSR